MSGGSSSFFGVAAVVGLLGSALVHMGPVLLRSAKTAAEEVAPAIQRVAEHATHHPAQSAQVAQQLADAHGQDSATTALPPPESPSLGDRMLALRAQTPNANPVHMDLVYAMKLEESERAAAATPAPSSTPPTRIPFTVDPAPMSVVELRRCLQFKDAIEEAVDKAVTAKSALLRERSLLLARDTELSAAIAEDDGTDPIEHVSVQIQADEIRADVAKHDRKSAEADRLADEAYELQDRYNRACTGRKYTNATYQAAVQQQFPRGAATVSSSANP